VSRGTVKSKDGWRPSGRIGRHRPFLFLHNLLFGDRRRLVVPEINLILPVADGFDNRFADVVADFVGSVLHCWLVRKTLTIGIGPPAFMLVAIFTPPPRLICF